MNSPQLTTGQSLSRYCTPEDCAYFLDFDGTLVEIAERPDGVVAGPALRTVLVNLNCAASGALAIVSGRPICEIDHWFHPIRWPVAGQHGAERRDARGTVHCHPLDQTHLDQLRTAAAEWQQRLPGLMIEDKGMSIAFHFRQNPELASPLEALLREQLRQLRHAYHLQTGKMVLEIKPDGLDKGRAIRQFLEEAPFAGRTPVFIGDDDTDEYGFAEVNLLGGVSIKVGAGPSVAVRRLDDVASVHDWLRRLVVGPASPECDLG